MSDTCAQAKKPIPRSQDALMKVMRAEQVPPQQNQELHARMPRDLIVAAFILTPF